MKKILLVEDDPFLIDIYTVKFKKVGYSVEVVSRGDMVLKKAKSIKPDLIILDIVLPNMDGWEVLQAIKKSNQLKKTKVIILSNIGEKEDIERGLKYGVVKYLIKSRYTPSEIAEEIKEII